MLATGAFIGADTRKARLQACRSMGSVTGPSILDDTGNDHERFETELVAQDRDAARVSTVEIEKWFQTLKMRVDRFHNSWVGSRLSVRQWLALFVHYYNFQRPQQALGGRTPVEEVI